MGRDGNLLPKKKRRKICRLCKFPIFYKSDIICHKCELYYSLKKEIKKYNNILCFEHFQKLKYQGKSYLDIAVTSNKENKGDVSNFYNYHYRMLERINFIYPSYWIFKSKIIDRLNTQSQLLSAILNFFWKSRCTDIKKNMELIRKITGREYKSIDNFLESSDNHIVCDLNYIEMAKTIKLINKQLYGVSVDKLCKMNILKCIHGQENEYFFQKAYAIGYWRRLL